MKRWKTNASSLNLFLLVALARIMQQRWAQKRTVLEAELKETRENTEWNDCLNLYSSPLNIQNWQSSCKNGQLKFRLKDQYQSIVITPILKTLNGYHFPRKFFQLEKYGLGKRKKKCHLSYGSVIGLNLLILNLGKEA